MRQPLSSWSQAASQEAPPPAAASARPAGFWIRLLAYLIDSLVLMVAMAVLAIPVVVAAMRGKELAAAVGVLIVYLGLFFATWLYFALMESSPRQATLGKLALGLAVTDGDGRRLGFGRATGRYFAKILSSLPANLGFVIAAFTDRKRALHDMVASTLVVRRRDAGTLGIVAALVGGLIGASFIAGVLAAIAIPNFIKYQLRSKAAEAPAALAALHAAQRAHAVREGEYRSLALPDGREPGPVRLEWSALDLAAAGQLGWPVNGSSFYTYRVEAGLTADGLPAYSACAEADLDGDGAFAAVVLWQPAVNAEGEVVALPPDPPCAQALALDRPLELGPEDPIGQPIRLTPPDVF